MRKLVSLAAGLLAFSASTAHSVSLDGVTASIIQESYFYSAEPCRSLSVVATIGADVELTAATGVSTGTCVGYFDVDIDPATELLTLTGRDIGNYTFGRLVITGLAPYGVAGVTTLSNNLFDPEYHEGELATATPAPQVSFAADSISIVFSPQGLGDGEFNYGNGDTYAAVFQLSAVPEPHSWALMAFGLAAVGAAARRRG